MLTVRFQGGQLVKTFDNIPDYILERRSSKILTLLDRIQLTPEQRADVRELVMRAIDEANMHQTETIDRLRLRMHIAANDPHPGTASFAGTAFAPESDYERVLNTVREITAYVSESSDDPSIRDFVNELVKAVCNIYYHTQAGKLKPSFIDRNQEAINELYNVRMFVFNVPTERRREYEIRYHVVVNSDNRHYGMSVSRGYHLCRTDTVLNLITARARALKYKRELTFKLSDDHQHALKEIIIFLGLEAF
jgi:ribosomal protein L19E